MHYIPRLFPHARLLIATALAAAAAAQAQAQTDLSPWTLRAGPAGVYFNSRTDAVLAGQAMPGARLGVQDNVTVALETGYALTPAWTARFVFGIPPTSTLTAQGTLRNYMPPLTGTLGRVRYAPAALSMTYGLGQWGNLRPYLGAGVTYTWVVADRDGDVANLNVRSAWGSVLELGADWPLDQQWSIFADVRKLFVSTSAEGTVPVLGGPPAQVKLRLNPAVVHVGLAYRF